jgi:hypothetical protein
MARQQITASCLNKEQDAPQIERWMREDDVDVAILVPL